MTEMLRFVVTCNVLPAASIARNDVKGTFTNDPGLV